jgi:hypothetical protein
MGRRGQLIAWQSLVLGYTRCLRRHEDHRQQHPSGHSDAYTNSITYLPFLVLSRLLFPIYREAYHLPPMRPTGLQGDVAISATAGAAGPTITSGYELVGVADFNGDGKPDYLLYDPSTHQTAIYYMNNNVLIGTADGPTLCVGWSLVAP